MSRFNMSGTSLNDAAIEGIVSTFRSKFRKKVEGIMYDEINTIVDSVTETFTLNIRKHFEPAHGQEIMVQWLFGDSFNKFIKSKEVENE